MSPGMDGLDISALERQVGDRLLRVQSPLRACLPGGDSGRCAQALANLRNPYAIEDDPGAFHTTGWLGAFDAGHSPVAVAAETPADIAAAVDFARDRGLGLVIKGTGHDYLGRSSAPGALLVWTHRMRDITVHDAFTPAGTGGPGVPAVTVGAKSGVRRRTGRARSDSGGAGSRGRQHLRDGAIAGPHPARALSEDSPAGPRSPDGGGYTLVRRWILTTQFPPSLDTSYTYCTEIHFGTCIVIT